MKVYDFDGTIYKKDSSVEFYKYCLRTSMSTLRAAPIQIMGFLLYIVGIYDKKKFKESFFSFLKYIPDVRGYVKSFWEEECSDRCFYDWYIEKKESEDVIISASPAFLVNEAANNLGIRFVIASEVEETTGRFLSENCRGIEKVTRFYRSFPDAVIDEFYSDSRTDDPMAEISKNAFIISDGQPVQWNFSKERRISIIETFRYIFWGGLTTLLNLFLFWLLIKIGIHYTFSNVFSYFIAVTASFFVNRRFVFRAVGTSSDIRAFIKFWAVRIASIAAETFALFLLIEHLNWNVFISKILISGVIIMATYLINKVYVFRGELNNKHEG